ncbi:MAG: pilus assembly PilX N-terminal domain-containing protein, partial [Psychromonas sp.]
MEKQKGFVLISVLVITTITTMLALAQIKEIRLQERIGGNQQKEINARLAAERGVFDAFAYIKEQNAANTSNAEIEIELKKSSFSEDKDYSFSSVSIDATSNTFTLISMGKVNGAVAYLKTQIESVESSSVFDDALVTCSELDLKGTFDVDSYNGEKKGKYSETKNEFGEGNGNVTVMNNGASIGGSAIIDGTLTASGEIYGATKTNVTGGTKPETTSALGDCDPLDIANSMPTFSGSLSDFPSGGVFEASTAPETLDILDESRNVYVFHDLDLSNESIEINGDVTLYLTGDLKTFKTDFSLVGDSTLTIFVEGTTYIKTNSDILSDNFANNGKAPLAIYSSNTTDDAVYIQGNAEMYMKLYAPLGTVSMNGGTKIMGSVRAGELDVVGTSAIHYDEGLGDNGGSGEAASVAYNSVYYHYEGTGDTGA